MLTQCCSVMGTMLEHSSEIIEEPCEFCDLGLLGLSVTLECRIAEVDIVGG